MIDDKGFLRMLQGAAGLLAFLFIVLAVGIAS